MRWLLVALVLLITAIDVFPLDTVFSKGLSAKNAVLYLIALFLFLRIVVGRNFTLEMRTLHVCFALLIAWAMISWVLSAEVIGYPRYDLVGSAIRLKSGLIDYAIFFLVFFHGTRTVTDAMTVLRALLLAALFANVATVVDAAGLVDLGFQARADGRVQGAIGESNQYAAFIVLLLPAMIASAINSRSLARTFWLATTAISLLALLMTASRGGMVALIAGGLWAAWAFRRHLTAGRVLAALAVVMAIGLALTAALSTKYGQLFQERMFSQSASIDLSTVSSGRTEIWTAALERMAATPVSFLTGFGWDVYWTMPFRYSPHNHYLGLWFNLGIPGLVLGTLLLLLTVFIARSASEFAGPPLRGHFIAFATGAVALCTAIFFVDLHQPWLYFWAYSGVVMRLAVAVRTEAHAALPAVSPAVATRHRDAFGWSVAGSR